MIALHAYQWMLLAACVLAVFEVLTGTYVALSLAVACMAVAALEYVTGAAAFARDGLLFAACAGSAIVVIRLLFSRPGDSKRAQGDVNEY